MSSQDEDLSNLSIYAELAGDLRKMVNSSELSDMTFVCEDGVEVYACRMLLAARSSFFRQMLLNGMAESNRDSTVKLPTVTSSVLIVVLKFLYVGKLSDEDLDPSMARINAKRGVETSSDDKSGSLRLDLLVKVALAASFFMLDSLERVITDKLISDLLGGGSHLEGSVDEIASRLSTIRGLDPKLWTGEGEVKSIEAICTSIVNSLMSQDLSWSTLLLMSEEAFRYYLTESRRISGDRHCEWSLDEYLRLRQILLWCAIRNDNGLDDGLGGPPDLDLTCLPGPDVALQFLEASEENQEINPDLGFDFSPGRTYLLNTIAKDPESLIPLLELVDLASIHPELLCNVIQPLKIIDPGELSEVLCAQALSSSRRLRKRLEHGTSSVWHLLFSSTYTGLWKVQDDDYFTLTPGKRDDCLDYMGVNAVVGLPILTPKCKEYEWEIVAIPSGSVEQCSMAGFEFGFYCLGKGETFDWKRDPSLSLSEDPRGAAVKINTDLQSGVFHHKAGSSDWKLKPGMQFEWRKPLKVTLVNDTCTFSYDGDWITFMYFVDRLEDEVLYPAIDFHVENLGIPFRPHYDQLIVGIQNLSGFEYKVAYNWLRSPVA